jgi:aryl-phospho-beta-D-glucosidase BglC (GH1 family)
MNFWRLLILLSPAIFIGTSCSTPNHHPVLPIPIQKAAAPRQPFLAITNALSRYRFEPGRAQDISKEGTWFKDSEGRYVLFRGVNIGSQSKFSPLYLPLRVNSFADVQAGLESISNCVTMLKDLGFNVVRFTVMWKGVEPTLSANVSPDYLNAVRTITDELYKNGIFVFIDFHQDIAHEIYGGDGFPDWAVVVDERHPWPSEPPAPNQDWQLRYVQLPWYVRMASGITKSECDDVRKTLNAFWMNDVENDRIGMKDIPAQAMEIGAVAKAAQFFKDDPAILGYEPFNEPNTVGLSKTNFEEQYLIKFYWRVLSEVRKVDTNAFLFCEPRTDWTIYPASAPEYDGQNFVKTPNDIHTFLGEADGSSFLAPDAPDTENPDKLVFSFHFYDPKTMEKAAYPWYLFWLRPDSMKRKEEEWPGLFESIVDAAKTRGIIPFMTEFGAEAGWGHFSTDLRKGIYDTQDRAYLDLGFQEIEKHLLNTTLWVYDFYTPGSEEWNSESFSLRNDFSLLEYEPGTTNQWGLRNADILARPYPMRSSAEPTLLNFDVGTRQAVIMLRGKPVNAPTVIYVPNDIQYTNQFEVQATSRDIYWDHENQLLYWAPDPHSDVHEIVIYPKGHFRRELLPEEAREVSMRYSFEPQ